MSLRDRIEDLRDDLESWLDERESWIPRALLLAYLGYGLVRHIADPLYRTWFGGITLAFHEMGHIVFIPFGRTMTIAGGSIMQLVVPLAAAIYLLVKQRDWFGFAVGLAWLSFSMFELATYIGDAARQELPLVSGRRSSRSGASSIGATPSRSACESSRVSWASPRSRSGATSSCASSAVSPDSLAEACCYDILSFCMSCRAKTCFRTRTRADTARNKPVLDAAPRLH